MIDADGLRRRTDLAALARHYGLELRREGKEQIACCPFHSEDTPSWRIYAKDGIQRYKCFGCAAAGDAIDFVREMEKLGDFTAAAKRLAELTSTPMPNGPTAKSKPLVITATYDYQDAAGALVFQVLRLEPKSFRQRRPDGKGGWIWNLDGVERCLYRLPQLAKADTVWIVEGEKDVHSLEARGIVATTAPGGAKAPWQPQYTEVLCGKHIILCGDTDKPGREYMARVAATLAGAAASIRQAQLPDVCKDISDYLEAGQQLDALTFAPVGKPAAATPAPTAAADPRWRDQLIVSNEKPKPILANAITVLRLAPEWSGVLWWDEFSLAPFARKPFPGFDGKGDTPWSDRFDALLTEWLHHEAIYVSADIAGRAVQTVAEERRFHPVREWLDSLKWDGDPRIDGWLTEYLGAEPSNYIYAVGPRWLISAVARIYEPGCKADCCLILEGEQGIRKSTALRTLGNSWFTDQIADLGSKDSAIDCRGVWIIEIAELDSMQRGEVGRIKAFMSRAVDRYRPPYGKRSMESPRQCVFAGSVNHAQYLRDETGARRFWPVACGVIDIDALARDREQIWAEAVAMYRDGRAWWLDTLQLEQEAAAQQKLRYEADPWQPRIEEWLASRTECTIEQALEVGIGKPIAQWTQADRNRVGRCLRALGWRRIQARQGQHREWRWRRDDALPLDDSPLLM